MTSKQHYKTAWHLARIIRYQSIVLEYGSHWEHNQYYSSCTYFNVPDSIADAARHHLKVRLGATCICEFCQRYQN